MDVNKKSFTGPVNGLNQFEVRARNMLQGTIIEALLHQEDVDLMSLAAANCGWPPLEVGEMMSVTYGAKRYEVVRKA